MVTYEELKRGKRKIAVIGQGYVGLPLSLALDKHFDVIGFDISTTRINELSAGRDRTREVSDTDLAECKVEFTARPEKINGVALNKIAAILSIRPRLNASMVA